MASESWGSSPLRTLLFERAYLFNFFQAVRLLESDFAHQSLAEGRGGQEAAEAVHFYSKHSLVAQSSIVREISQSAPEKLELKIPPAAAAHMQVASLGLWGVLPKPFKQLVLNDKSGVLASFLNIFDHRLIGLQYRAWANRRIWLGFEHDRPAAAQQLESQLLAVFGTTSSCIPELPMAKIPFLRLATRLGRGLITPLELRRLLEQHFRIGVEIDQFRGRWSELRPEERSRLGRRDATTRLGEGLIVGKTIYHAQHTFRIRLGPLEGSQYLSFMPGGDSFRDLQVLVWAATGNRYDEIELELILRRGDATGTALGRPLPESPDGLTRMTAFRLGQTSWLLPKSACLVRQGRCVVLLSAPHTG